MLLRYRGRSDEANAVLASIGPTTTVYEEALFLKVEESLPWIASGEMTVDELPVVESEEGRLGVFIGAWQALGKRDWPALLSYENRLRNTRMSDLWAPYVAQLRAEWRLRADDSDGRLAREALHFVDQSVATQATLDGYTQRARAGLKLNDGPVFIESVAYVLQMIQQRMWEIEYAGSELSDMEYQSVILRLDEFATQLERFMIPDQSGRARRVSLQLQKVRASVQR
jgi:hypothetical protein